MKKVTEIPPGYYDTAPNYTAERVDEMQELGLQLGDAHAEIRRQAKEIEVLKAMQDAVDAGDGTLHNLIDKQAKEIEGLRAAARQALAVLKGCLEHPDADDAIAALNNAAIAQQTKETE